VRLGRNVALTDPGRKRRRNEDSYVARPPLFAVADGMGGAQAGEIASRLAVEAMEGPAAGGDGENRVAALIQEANRRIYERSHEDATVSGMGTTITAALVGEDGHVAIGHVGDSRAYLLREGRLEQLTDDHSLVAELVRTGKLSEEEAESHPQRSVITRALGTDPDVDVDTFTIEAQPGDLFLLCSDGLTTMVDDDEILRTLEQSDDLEEAARTLVRKANRGGGEDNITLVFFEIAEGEPDAPPDATVEMPSLDGAAEDEDGDDTLTELDRVPAVDTMVVPAEEVEQAYEREQERRSAEAARLDKTAKRVLSIIVVVALVVAAVAVLLWGLFL
jgi:serine/threonine protein phosphatase PrpC